MPSRLLSILGLGQHKGLAHHRIAFRSFHVSQAGPAAEACQQTAKVQSGLPHGRLYLPSGLQAAAQLPEYTAAAAAAAAVGLRQQRECVSITVQCASDSTRIVVINGGSSGPAALSGAARAAATGAWPTLPTWLFGFACGSAAATAMAYNYLRPQGAAAAAAVTADSIPRTGFMPSSGASMQISSTGSSSTGSTGSLNLTDLSFFSSSSSSDSCSSSSSSAAGLSVRQGIWAYLQQLGRLGAASAQAASTPYPDNLLLPVPWEQTDSSSSSSTAAACAADGSSSNAVMTRSSISSAAAAAAPAVVHLVATGTANPAAAAAAALAPGLVDGRAQGSGFIYDPRGYILTNAHVVLGTAPTAALSASSTGARSPRLQHSSSWRARADGSSATAAAAGLSAGGILVHLHDGRVFDGRLVDLDRASDLAVVQVAAPEPLPYCRLGNSHQLRVGEWVVALGSPFLLRQSVTAGIVSCVERKGSELGLPSPRTEFIQTDAAINVGNSGGPLVNLDGEVVGMNNMKAAAADGVSFAIPINTIKQLVSEISRHGRVLRPYVGITMAEVRLSRMAQLRTACPDFPCDVAAGIVITRVTPGSPAAAAGLRDDDVIVGLQGVRPENLGPAGLSVASLADALKGAIGGSLDLLVVREQHAAAAAGKRQNGAAGGSSSSSTGRYSYVTVTVKPVEAPVPW